MRHLPASTMVAQPGGEDQTQNGTADRDDHDVQSIDLCVVVENKDARDGKCQTACDHGACRHGGVGDVDFVHVGIAQSLQTEHGSQCDEHDGPGQRGCLQSNEHGRAGQNDGADYTDDNAAHSQLLFKRRSVLYISLFRHISTSYPILEQ